VFRNNSRSLFRCFECQNNIIIKKFKSELNSRIFITNYVIFEWITITIFAVFKYKSDWCSYEFHRSLYRSCYMLIAFFICHFNSRNFANSLYVWEGNLWRFFSNMYFDDIFRYCIFWVSVQLCHRIKFWLSIPISLFINFYYQLPLLWQRVNQNINKCVYIHINNSHWKFINYLPTFIFAVVVTMVFKKKDGRKKSNGPTEGGSLSLTMFQHLLYSLGTYVPKKLQINWQKIPLKEQKGRFRLSGPIPKVCKLVSYLLEAAPKSL